jgi:very-short-patch-repair endonuclease
LGFTKREIYRRVQAGHLHRIGRGVYAVGHRRLTTRARWLAAVLACGPTAALSNRFALALRGLRPTPPGPIEVTVVGSGRRSPPGIRLHRARTRSPQDVITVDAIPVTSLPRTLIDYAQSASPAQLRTVLEAAERFELLDDRAIQETLDRSPGRATKRLRAALAEITDTVPWTRSELEREFLTLVREAGLPEPQVNVSVLGDDADFFWPHAGLVVETDSWGFHRTRARFEEDRRRDTRRQLHGLRAIRLTQRRIQSDRAAVQADLRAFLTDPDLL